MQVGEAVERQNRCTMVTTDGHCWTHQDIHKKKEKKERRKKGKKRKKKRKETRKKKNKNGMRLLTPN